jgi:hypothetical protein
MAGRHALIVATDAYADAKLSRLRAPAKDAEALADVLRDPAIGEFEVELALNQPEATLRRRIAAFFSDRSREELLLLHFSCHGLKDDSGQLFFAAADTEVAHLDATAIPAEFVSRQMARSRSNNVLMLLDCCYSGAIARGLTFRAGDRVDVHDHLGGSGRAIITASNAMEYAFEGDELTGEGRPSVFTSAVVKALETGEADRDQDHWISVRELYDYVCDEVREITPNQRPNMLSHLEGELFVARSRWVVPATLPRELLDGLENQFAPVREGAVAALGELLHGRDRSLAAAARSRLESVAAGDDSRRVAAAASAALAATPPAPEPPAPPPAAAEPAAPPPAADPAPVAAPTIVPISSTVRKPDAAEPEAPTAPQEPSSLRVVWEGLDVPSRWLAGALLLLLFSLPLQWDYGNAAYALLGTDSYGPVGVAVGLVLVTTLGSLTQRALAYGVFGLAAGTLGLVAAMLRIQNGDGAGAGLWLGIAGLAIAAAASAWIVIGMPERTRRRLLPAEVIGALAGLYAAYLGATGLSDPEPTDVIAIAVAALAAPALAIPRPARLRPLAIIGCGAFIAAYLLLADFGETGTGAIVAGFVMLVAGGIALYQRTQGSRRN